MTAATSDPKIRQEAAIMSVTHTPAGPRTLVAGDSWMRGLSKGQGSLSRLVPAAVQACDVLDISRISRITTEIADEHLEQIDAYAPQFAFLGIGGADSLVFPAPWFQRLIDRFAPPKWHGIEGLQPAAVRALSRRARIRQRVDLVLKTVLKQLVVNLFGSYRRSPIGDFEAAARRILAVLERHGTTTVLMGFTEVEELTSPKTNASIAQTNEVLRRLAREFPHTLYVDTIGAVHKWDDYLVDRVHLSRAGHKKVAEHLMRTLADAGEPFSSLLPARQDIARLAG